MKRSEVRFTNESGTYYVLLWLTLLLTWLVELLRYLANLQTFRNGTRSRVSIETDGIGEDEYFIGFSLSNYCVLLLETLLLLLLEREVCLSRPFDQTLHVSCDHVSTINML